MSEANAGGGDCSCSEQAKVPSPGSLRSPPSPPTGGRVKIVARYAASDATPSISISIFGSGSA